MALVAGAAQRISNAKAEGGMHLLLVNSRQIRTFLQ
jgi:hypothetical protein